MDSPFIRPCLNLYNGHLVLSPKWLLWRGSTVWSFSFRGGLRSGDIITKMNGKTTESSKQVYQHVHKGEILKIEVKRGEQYLNFTVQPEVVG